MTKNLFLILALMLLAFLANAQFSVVKESLYFDNDKFELRELEEKKLIQLWDSISSDSILRIYITGNTDNSADSLYNIKLSNNRCNTVQDFFISRQVNQDVFKIKYYGENKPIAPNINDKGKQINRRVDLRVVYKTTQKKTIEVIPAVLIDTCLGVDTTIVLENGTQLIFNTCEYNNIKECLQIKSARTTEELIENDLSLETDDNVQLITCGMIGLCLTPNCKIPNPLVEYVATVRFPFPSEPNCIPCSRTSARVFLINDDGSWTQSTNPNDKIRIVKINGLKYYEMEMIINSDGCVWTNCDCKYKCPEKWWPKRKVCPKSRVKVPFGYTLIQANIYIDCPQSIIEFVPKERKFLRRKRLGKNYTKCHYEPSLIQVSALDRKGNLVKLEPSPIDSVRHRILFSKCKKNEKDKQKLFWVFSTKSRVFYKKYRIKRKDLTKG